MPRRIPGRPAAPLCLATAAIWCATFAAVRAGLRRVEVAGTSMEPALAAGDRLLLVRGRRARPGLVVSLPDPRDPARTVVKRVFAAHGGLLDLRGDNQSQSTDSRTWGLVASRHVTGVALYRYAPRDRVGRLRPTGQPGPRSAGNPTPAGPGPGFIPDRSRPARRPGGALPTPRPSGRSGHGPPRRR
ncbi:MAG: S26 family signal peptidase [Acidimicrobiales bacterium]